MAKQKKLPQKKQQGKTPAPQPGTRAWEKTTKLTKGEREDRDGFIRQRPRVITIAEAERVWLALRAVAPEQRGHIVSFYNAVITERQKEKHERIVEFIKAKGYEGDFVGTTPDEEEFLAGLANITSPGVIDEATANLVGKFYRFEDGLWVYSAERGEDDDEALGG